jgi:amidase
MAEWYFESVRELARRIRLRELSSVELLEAMLKRIDEVNGRLNAVVVLAADRAREEAKRADAALARGELLGPLHGVPLTVKEAWEVAGMRTTSGAKRWKDHVPQRDATVMKRLRGAGAIIVGKTNVPTYCADWQTFNDLYGTTNNPWDVTRTPGGSSGGAAAAVAAGLTPVEVGSDIAGSIRLPSAFCGLFGHKVTFDLIPMHGHLPPVPGAAATPDLGVAGPIARNADDLAFLLPILAGPPPAYAKAYSLRLPPPRAASLRGYRVAAWLDDPAFPIDAEVSQCLQATVDALRRAGVRIEEAKPDFSLAEMHANYHKVFDPVILSGSPASVMAQFEAAAASQSDDPLIITARNTVSRHYQWIAANEERMQLRARLARFFDNYDVLLCPITPVPAFPHDHSKPQFARLLSVNGKPVAHTALTGWVSVATATGNPATVMPAGRTKAGLPVGLQIIGPFLEDLTSIDFAGRASDVAGGFEPPPGF